MDKNDNNIRLNSEAEITNDHVSSLTLKKILALIIILAAALLLCLFRFKLPVVPSIVSVDFSIIAEIIASLAYGPIAGVVITILKFAIHTGLTEETFLSNFSNLFIESTFVVFIRIFYSAYIADQMRKNQEQNRKKAIFFGGLWAAIPTLIVQFFVQNYYLFPKIDWKYGNRGVTTEILIASYAETVEIIRAHLPQALQSLLPKVTEIWQAILFVNMPITFMKLMISTLIAIPIYLLTSSVLHFNSKN